MGKKKSVKTKDEEIDLGKLFSIIGNAFSKLFDFIVKLLKGAFHYLILFLLFLKGHILKLLIAIVLGSFIGFYADYTSPSKYTYDMIIQPNYSAVDQISENVEYYNMLINQNEITILSEKLNMSLETATNLVEFKLIPYNTEKEKLINYDEFIKETDTLTHKNFTYDTFKELKFDSDKYVFRIVSRDNKLKSLEKTIISDVEKNTTLQNKRRITTNNLKLDSIATVKAIKEASDLRELYKEVTLREASKIKESSSTNLDFSKEAKQSNDIQLFEIVKNLNHNLIELEKEKERSVNIVNIITSFNPSGKKAGTLYETKAFRWGILFGGILLGFIFLKILNEYLKKYQVKNN